MSNENHNKDGNWKKNLEALDNLPSETADKNALWEKLHERLREKKGNKKIIWYWSAAASLLLVLMIPLINSDKKHPEQLKKETVQKEPVIKSSPNILTDTKDSVQTINSVPFEKNQQVIVTSKGSIKYPVAIPGTLTGIHHPAGTVSNENIIKEPVINETSIPVYQPLDTSMNIAAVPFVNKKLNVVHINELGDPVDESPRMAHNAEIHYFQLKLGNQEVYVNSSSLASRTGVLPIIKSKTSPN